MERRNVLHPVMLMIIPSSSILRVIRHMMHE